MVNIIYDQHTTKKIHNEFAVLSICFYKRICCSDNTRFTQDIFLRKATTSTDIGKRKESCPSVAVLLQKADHTLRSLFMICNNILDTATKCCLDSNFIIFLYMNNIGNYAPDTRFTAFLLHNATDTVTVTIIPLCNVAERFQTGCLPVICSLSDFHLRILFL